MPFDAIRLPKGRGVEFGRLDVSFEILRDYFSDFSYTGQ
jgi:hypothetical protein